MIENELVSAMARTIDGIRIDIRKNGNGNITAQFTWQVKRGFRSTEVLVFNGSTIPFALIDGLRQVCECL
jgi:hypothetical protein